MATGLVGLLLGWNGDESETAARWRDSPLQTAVERVEEELRRTAEDGDLVVAVTDAQTRILWTYGGRVMRRRAETVNFVVGGRWDDRSVGTNPLDLANRQGQPATVFSSEHYAPIVHNWPWGPWSACWSCSGCCAAADRRQRHHRHPHHHCWPSPNSMSPSFCRRS